MPAPPPKAGRWKKGQTGNPNGSSAKKRVKKAFRALMPEVAAKAPLMTPEALSLMIAGIMAGTIEDVKEAKERLGDRLCFTYSNWVTALQMAAKKGDVASLIKAAEFIHGSKPDRLEVTGRDGAPLAVRNEAMTVEQMEAELVAIRKRKKAQGIE